MDLLTDLISRATEDGDKSHGDVLSYLPGQRLSRCTCPGESHPGPIHEDGTYVGRSAPEIDVFEATITYTTPMQGQVSQSGQWAPFNWKYEWYNTSDNLIISDDDVTKFNDYLGGVYQQASSCLSMTNQQAYETNGGLFSVYAFEYKPGFDDAYVDYFCSYVQSLILINGNLGILVGSMMGNLLGN